MTGENAASKDRKGASAGARSGTGSPRVAQIEAALYANYARYQYCYVDLFAENLADVSRVFKGDMQMAVLLGIIGQMTLQAATTASLVGKALTDFPSERRGITTFRLADATGIPRETARRKLVAMERMGWLERDGSIWLLAVSGTESAARRDLGELDARAVKRVAQFLAAMVPIVIPQEEAPK